MLHAEADKCPDVEYIGALIVLRGWGSVQRLPDLRFGGGLFLCDPVDLIPGFSLRDPVDLIPGFFLCAPVDLLFRLLVHTPVDLGRRFSGEFLFRQRRRGRSGFFHRPCRALRHGQLELLHLLTQPLDLRVLCRELCRERRVGYRYCRRPAQRSHARAALRR